MNPSKKTKSIGNSTRQKNLAVAVSDLTYVRVNGKWHGSTSFVDLFKREIIGSSRGPNKAVALVYQGLSSINRDLRRITYFHTVITFLLFWITISYRFWVISVRDPDCILQILQITIS
ncbi:hypothetical protein [Bacillus sp. MUM 13]|uniref:hypothetical protein n=1 Tax=Bacillus sp. MUM 13 TaxID=1678001 RepID=UPI0011145443|nr:hypothetical protein [Bacillus sp. MUM 13]